jgi:hypothetical protein
VSDGSVVIEPHLELILRCAATVWASRRISQAAAAAETSLAANLRLPAPSESVEQSGASLGDRLVRQSLRAMTGGLDQLLLDCVLRDVHPGGNLLL